MFAATTRFLLVACLVACGDDGATPAPDAPAADAGPDAQLSPIVGSWDRQPLNPGAAERVTFAANGQYHDPQHDGTWQVRTDGQLEFAYGTSKEIGDFYMSPDQARLLTFAMLPMGATDGFVGTWKGRYEVANTPTDATMEVRADHTATWTEVRPSGPRVSEGTWTLDLSRASMDFTLGGTTPVSIGFRVIPDVAIGTYLHTRVP